MFDNILVLSPHTDDGELGAGGCIARFVSEGKRVSYVALSACEQSVPDEFPPDILKQEVKKATKVLGISSDDLLLYGFEVRMFPQHRQEILDTLLEVRDRVNPDLVLGHLADKKSRLKAELVVESGFGYSPADCL